MLHIMHFYFIGCGILGVGSVCAMGGEAANEADKSGVSGKHSLAVLVGICLVWSITISTQNLVQNS